MFTNFFSNITGKDKADAVQRLMTHSSPSRDFFMMVILSVLMATFGLLINSAAVIVGSMLIAPVLYPILSISMGLVMSDSKLVLRSFRTLLKSALFAVITSTAVTLLFTPNGGEYTTEILSRTEPSLIYAAIGAVAGLAASFAMVKQQLNETLPGVAISVALVPPLSVVGIGLARFDGALVFSSLLLFLVNAIGVIFTSMVVFSLMNFYTKRQIADRAIKEEERTLEKEKLKIPEQPEING